MRTGKLFLLALLLALDYQKVGAETKPVPQLIKRAETRVIDGDTIVIAGIHHRLWGIDAPELGQVCKDKWPAGDKSRGFLRVLIEGQTVNCDDRGPDKYGRTLSVCWAGLTNLNEAMVRTGNAWAYTLYTPIYLPDEISARNSKSGVHAHDCIPAWDWRHGKLTPGVRK